MVSDSARYLIRFDDLCPTMLRDRFGRFQSIFARYNISPILAVVPDNQDPDLNLQAPDPRFWDRIRSLESAGATIAMHGFHHLCTSRGKSLLALHDETEFAGVEETLQREWIRSGLKILRSQGLNPRLFVAPRHGFDRGTLRVLASEGLSILSDGFARRPFLRHEVIWIPQQLWEPVTKNNGLWTICIHTNTATSVLEDKLEKFLATHADRFTSFDRVIAENPSAHLRWTELIEEAVAHLRVKVSGARSRRIHAA